VEDSGSLVASPEKMGTRLNLGDRDSGDEPETQRANELMFLAPGLGVLKLEEL